MHVKSRKYIVLVWFFFLFLSTSFNLLSVWFNNTNQVLAQGTWQSGWTYRKVITINDAQVPGSGSYSNFPVLISLNSDADLAADAQDDGDDILFTDNSGSKLSHEIERFDGDTGELIVWVKVPSLAATADTTLYLYYGNAGASNQQEATSVWDVNYRGVWHLKESANGSAGEYKDATSSNNTGRGGNGTASAVPTRAAGKIGYAQDLDGTDYVLVADNDSLDVTGDITMSGWVKYDQFPTSGTNANPRLFQKSQNATSTNYYLSTNSAGANKVARARVISSATYNADATTNMSTGTWYYLTGVREGTSLRIYVNGVQEGNIVISSANLTTNNEALYFGRSPGNTDGALDGMLDELRVSTVARSADWIATEYSNQNNPSSFSTLGSEETYTPGNNPSVSINSYTPDPTTDNTPTFTGTATDSDGTVVNVEFQVDSTSGSWSSCTANDSSFNSSSEEFSCTTPTLNDGSHTVYFRATDNDSNYSSTASDTLTIDTTAPSVPGTPSVSTPTTDSTPTWNWSASTDATSGLAGNAYTVQWSQTSDFSAVVNSGVSSSASFTHSTPLSNNTWYFRVKAVDAAGNESSYSSAGSVSINTLASAGYPASTYVTGITFDDDSIQEYAPGSDNWPITWAEDGHIYTSFGDGGGFGGTNSIGRVSMGVARIEGNKDSYVGYNVAGGVGAGCAYPFEGKSLGILAIGNELYMWRNGDGSNTDSLKFSRLYKSTDFGCTWVYQNVEFSVTGGDFTNGDLGFFAPTFTQFGRGYQDARDEYVYIYAPESYDHSHWNIQFPGAIALIRVPQDELAQKSSYQFFAGLDENDQPTWTNTIADREPVWEDATNGTHRMAVSYNAGLQRYFLTTMYTNRTGRIAMYEAPEPWGPWKSVLFEQNTNRWGSLSIAFNFVNKWLSEDGLDFVLVYSKDDTFASIEGQFTVDTAPVANLTPISPDPVASSSVTLTGTASDSDGFIELVEYQVDSTSGNWSDCQADDGTFEETAEDFSCTATNLNDGAHTIYVRVTDANSARSEIVSDSFTIDTEEPTISLTPLSPDPNPSGSPDFTGTATDVTTAIALVEYQVDSTNGSWSDCVASDGDFDGLSEDFSCEPVTISDGTHTLYARSTDSAGNVSDIVSDTFEIQSSGPLTSAVAANATSSNVTITWTTDVPASSQVDYGYTNSYANSTAVTDTSPRVTDHSVTISSLLSCTTYYYRVRSMDSESNETLASGSYFNTSGCTGSSTINNFVSAAVSVNSNSDLELSRDLTTLLTLSTPVGYAASDVTFQLKELQKNAVTNAIGVPVAGQQIPGNHVYDLKAITNANALLTNFLEPLVITIYYTTAEITNFDTTSLRIYRYTGTEWQALNNCTTNTTTRTVSCETTEFSIFALGGSGISATPTPTPSPTSNPTNSTPRPNSNSRSTSSSRTSTTNKNCTTPRPVGTPDLFEIVRESGRVMLHFSPANLPYDGFLVTYGFAENEEIYSAKVKQAVSSGVVIVPIADLTDTQQYAFKVQATNGCAVGESSNWLTVPALKPGQSKLTRFKHGGVLIQKAVRTIVNALTSVLPDSVKPTQQPVVAHDSTDSVQIPESTPNVPVVVTEVLPTNMPGSEVTQPSSTPQVVTAVTPKPTPVAQPVVPEVSPRKQSLWQRVTTFFSSIFK